MPSLFRTQTTDHLLTQLREGRPLDLRQQVVLTALLSLPSILAMVSHVLMEYIDAAMVGRLGADPSASVGLMASSAWMIWGLCSSAATGFSVQVAHLIGARDEAGARSVVRQGLTSTLLSCLAVMAVALAISGQLPRWLGGADEICPDATAYFRIVTLTLPFTQLVMLFSGALRSSGNVVAPSLTNAAMCLLDVVFNFLFIFPARHVSILGVGVTVPGAGLGVRGAALGTMAAEFSAAAFLAWFVVFRSKPLRLSAERGSFLPSRRCLSRAVRIALPMGVQHVVMTGAQVVSTGIVAPLGKMSIAANSFGVTAESICYMPGYGIADAAQALVGQSLGAGRRQLMRGFARVTVVMAMVVMSLMGVLMYFGAPLMMELLTPVGQIRELGVEALRIEAFAEPMFAASIVCYGVFVGAGDTLKPCIMNLASIWAVRLSLAWLLAPSLGLAGVWTAMCVELCFRGLIFLARLRWGKWDRAMIK